jgi:hypothetical protein
MHLIKNLLRKIFLCFSFTEVYKKVAKLGGNKFVSIENSFIFATAYSETY